MRVCVCVCEGALSVVVFRSLRFKGQAVRSIPRRTIRLPTSGRNEPIRECVKKRVVHVSAPPLPRPEFHHPPAAPLPTKTSCSRPLPLRGETLNIEVQFRCLLHCIAAATQLPHPDGDLDANKRPGGVSRVCSGLRGVKSSWYDIQDWCDRNYYD